MAAAEYPLVITQATAQAGAQRRISFHGSDGREHSVVVDIPPGVTNGTRLPVALSDETGGALMYGELVVRITVVPHQVSECRGADLYVTLQVDRASAARAGRIEVPLGDGRVLAVPIEAGTTHNRFVYGGQGLLRGYAPRRYGDLVLRLELLDVDEPDQMPAIEQASAAAAPERPREWWRALFGAE